MLLSYKKNGMFRFCKDIRRKIDFLQFFADLFSADAFGKFGALDAEDEWECEARRYYFGIVGKYGPQVQAVELLAQKLEAAGCPKVVVTDLARSDWAEAVEDAFRYGKLVLATTTYNADIFPDMKHFIQHLTECNYQNRTVGLMENGSWAPKAAGIMKEMLSECKNITYTDTAVKILSALNEESIAQIEAQAKELCGQEDAEEEVQPEEKKTKKYICTVCGYEHEGELPADYECPLCGVGPDLFELAE